jgi:hypothetical protein
MYSDYKTTTTYFIVIATFMYAVYMQNESLASVIVVPMIVMWAILKTNSKELLKELLEVIKTKWSK